MYRLRCLSVSFARLKEVLCFNDDDSDDRFATLIINFLYLCRSYQLQEVTEKMKSINEQYPIGGIVLYAWNINDETQLSRFISQIRALNGSPLLCIDEEGGLVARIAKNPNFNVKKYESS